MADATDIAGATLAGAVTDKSVEQLGWYELGLRLANPLDGAAQQEFARRCAQAAQWVPREELRAAGEALASIIYDALGLAPGVGPFKDQLVKLATGVSGSAAQGKAPRNPPTITGVVAAERSL